MTISTVSAVTTMQFYYNAFGVPVAFKYNGTLYYYLTNLQGDVIGIINDYGVCATYTYDAWGRIIDTFAVSSTDSTLLNVNPLRYRGYIYDTETGFYYLQSRYYDPDVGRFINVDGQLNGGLLGNNLYAYCENNPVNLCDPCGTACICLRKRVHHHTCKEQYEEIYRYDKDDLYHEDVLFETINTEEQVILYYQELSYNDLEKQNEILDIGITAILGSLCDILGWIFTAKDFTSSLNNEINVATDYYGNKLYIEKGYEIMVIERIYIFDSASATEVQYVLFDRNRQCVFNKTIINTYITD